jgi:hypothetical protein
MFRFAIFVFATLPLGAQWLHLPTPGIPRTADGKPNLTARAPRKANPISGLWGGASDKCYNNISADQEAGVVQAGGGSLSAAQKDFGKDSMETLCIPPGPPTRLRLIANQNHPDAGHACDFE